MRWRAMAPSAPRVQVISKKSEKLGVLDRAFFTFHDTSQATMASNLGAEADAPSRAPPQHHPDADHPNGAEDKFERFERWLRENGAYFPEVSYV